MSAVSLPAKNAARMSNPASAPKSVLREKCGIGPRSLLAPMSPEHILEDELHAKIRDRQDAEAAQGPAHGRAPAPSVSHPPDQEHTEQQPRNQRQGGLLHQSRREYIG